MVRTQDGSHSTVGQKLSLNGQRKGAGSPFFLFAARKRHQFLGRHALSGVADKSGKTTRLILARSTFGTSFRLIGLGLGLVFWLIVSHAQFYHIHRNQKWAAFTGRAKVIRKLPAFTSSLP